MTSSSRASPARGQRRGKSNQKGMSIAYTPPTIKAENPVASYFYIEHSDNERFTVNANCLCKLIYEYIRLKAGLPDQLEFDLVDMNGNPLDFYNSKEGASGRDFFDHKKTYYIVILQRTSSGFLYNPRLHLHASHPEFQRVMKSMMTFFETSPSKVEAEHKKRKNKRKSNAPAPERSLSDRNRTIHKHHAVIF